MKRYNIKSLPDRQEYIDILKETENEFYIRFTRINDGSIKTREEMMSKHLFNTCVQTGYLYPVMECSVA